MSEALEPNSAKSVLIVGGGSAGWLTATILASRYYRKEGNPLQIKLIEAPDIPIIGVGEGTWPGMKNTLRNAGINENDFLRECNASFKQGSKFVGWKNGSDSDFYYHPFELPEGFYDVNLAQQWVEAQPAQSFSEYVCVQEAICEEKLCPKLLSSRDYSGVANYGYHLDAGKFSEFLKRHCVENLGVSLVRDKVTNVIGNPNGDIQCVQTENSGELEADLFIDCTGFRSLLLGGHYGIEFLDKSDVLPINSALAVQKPYEDSEIAQSVTVSTAQEAGWIWDISLVNRRGVGHVYCDSYISETEAAQQLQSYLGCSDAAFDKLSPRSLSITPGYRKEFWHQNCVAVGLSAGFIEPLEASAMMMIESAADMIADMLPVSNSGMKVVSDRFNQRFHYRWECIIDFLKLHYLLSDREEKFWRDQSQHTTVSERLRADLEYWKYQIPWKNDFDSVDDLFPIASYQYVLFGMGFETASKKKLVDASFEIRTQTSLDALSRKSELLLSKLGTNNHFLESILSL